MKTHRHKPEGAQRASDDRLVRLTALLAICVAVIMVAMKGFAWFVTGSVALLGAFLDAIMDLSLSVMNFFVIRHAQTPADREHRFGHGKAEALAALAQASFLSLLAAYLIYESALALSDPEPIDESLVGIGIILVSIVLTLGLVFVQKRVAKATQSVAIEADSAHYEADLYMNLAIIVTLVLSGQFGLPHIDPLLGLVVAGLMANSARQVFISAGNQLMDRELDETQRAEIKHIILSHPLVRGLHDLRTRRAGTNIFIQCHIELDGDISLNQAHRISDAVEAQVMATFPTAEVMIHQDPEGHEELTPLERS
jgi:ferrous-iron efflux pump FieF